jgi:hypothetical protein
MFTNWFGGQLYHGSQLYKSRETDFGKDPNTVPRDVGARWQQCHSQGPLGENQTEEPLFLSGSGKGRPGGEIGKYVPEAGWERAQEGHRMVVGVLRGWGQRKANDMGWPMFYDEFVNYPFIRKSGGPTGRPPKAWQRTTWLRRPLGEGKYANNDVRKMTGNIESLGEMWSTIDTCFESP